VAQLYAYIPWSCNRAQIANATERKADGFMTNPNQTANVGHRYQKGHPYHPPKAPLNGGSEHQRLKSKFFRALKMEYGPELTASQKEHIFDLHRDHRPTGHNLKMQSVAFQPCADPPPDNANPILRSTVSFMRIFRDLQKCSAIKSRLLLVLDVPEIHSHGYDDLLDLGA
jgi:hypothetical protein